MPRSIKTSSFDIQKDIVPVISTFTSPNTLVVNPSVPAKTLPEFIAYAKANPGKINYASFGVGSAPNMNGELLKLMAGINLVHVPYRQSPVPDLLSGQVQAFFGPMPITHRDREVRQIACLGGDRAPSGPTRCRTCPPLPNSMPGFDADIWHGIGAPKGTPKEIIATLNKEINAILADAGDQGRSSPRSAARRSAARRRTTASSSPAEIDKWGKVIKAANIKPVAEH